mgnify:CR=1 FL=1
MAGGKLPELPIKMMMNVGNPERAFSFAQIPNAGVGLARLEFIINNMVGIHPQALLQLERVPADVRAEIEERIRTYRLQARKGSLGLIFFVVISIFAIPGLRFLPDLPEKARQILGAPPKPEWISLALVVYVFSALILILARITQGSGG